MPEGPLGGPRPTASSEIIFNIVPKEGNKRVGIGTAKLTEEKVAERLDDAGIPPEQFVINEFLRDDQWVIVVETGFEELNLELAEAMIRLFADRDTDMERSTVEAK